jgi:hypothetical protein
LLLLAKALAGSPGEFKQKWVGEGRAGWPAGDDHSLRSTVCPLIVIVIILLIRSSPDPAAVPQGAARHDLPAPPPWRPGKGVLEFAFRELNLQRVAVGCESHNGSGLKMLQKAGMRWEGEFVEAYCIRNEWVNTVWFAKLRQEYIK